MVYEKARGYLRDHPKEALRARELAKAIGEDERLVEILMLEGRFENKDNGGLDDREVDKKRKKLLEDLQKSLSVPAAKEAPATTYGSDRHGTDRFGKN
jgi:hypothetical protein